MTANDAAIWNLPIMANVTVIQGFESTKIKGLDMLPKSAYGCLNLKRPFKNWKRPL